LDDSSGPALGMFEGFGRTGPPILGGVAILTLNNYSLSCQFWKKKFSNKMHFANLNYTT